MEVRPGKLLEVNTGMWMIMLCGSILTTRSIFSLVAMGVYMKHSMEEKIIFSSPIYLSHNFIGLMLTTPNRFIGSMEEHRTIAALEGHHVILLLQG